MPPNNEAKNADDIAQIKAALWGGPGNPIGLESRFEMITQSLEKHLRECNQRYEEAAAEAKRTAQQARADTRKLLWSMVGLALSIIGSVITAILVAKVNQWIPPTP